MKKSKDWAEATRSEKIIAVVTAVVICWVLGAVALWLISRQSPDLIGLIPWWGRVLLSALFGASFPLTHQFDQWLRRVSAAKPDETASDK